MIKTQTKNTSVTMQNGHSINGLSSRQFRAVLLLRRWGWIIRCGLPYLGYPRHSIEQSLAVAGTQELLLSPEDEECASVMQSFNHDMMRIARQRWSNGMSISAISKANRMSRRSVRTRLNFIIDTVADRCF